MSTIYKHAVQFIMMLFNKMPCWFTFSPHY